MLLWVCRRGGSNGRHRYVSTARITCLKFFEGYRFQTKINTSSVSPELLHRFARVLAPVAFLQNITLLSINMKVIWRASLLKNCEQANQCNNSGETEEVIFFLACGASR